MIVVPKRTVLFVHDGPLYFDRSLSQYYGIHYDNHLVRRYLELGDQVTFLMRLNQIDPNEIQKFSLIDEPGFSFIEIPNFKSLRTYLRNHSSAVRLIRNAVIEHDVIVIRFPSAAGAIAFRIAQNLHKPVLVEMVACVFDALWNFDWRGRLIAHYKAYKYRRLLQIATHTIYVTNIFLQSRYPTRGKYIGCSDVQLLHSESEVLKSRIDRIKQLNRPLVLCTVAALNVAYKGQANVIKAIGILKRKGLIFKYKLIGQGDSDRIRKTIIKNETDDLVEIVGPLPHGKIFDFLNDIDIYIQPSKVEGLPRALVEAMSKGCPCLGSFVGGISELLNEDSIFTAGSPEAIVTKLKQINTVWMLKQAELNYYKAQEFQREILEKRRKAFYREFLCDYSLENQVVIEKLFYEVT